MKISYIYHLLIAVLAGSFLCAHAETLINDQEAALPALTTQPTSRGIVRGPAVKWIYPKTDMSVRSPFNLKVIFESREGIKIDPDSVKVVYLKSPLVDLTPRLQSAVTPLGIDLRNAEVPPGSHTIRLTVKDLEGRETNSQMTITVSK